MSEILNFFEEIIYLLVALGVIVLPFYFMSKFINDDKKQVTPQDEKEIDTDIQEDEKMGIKQSTDDNDEYPYQKVYLLTKNEWSFYRSLKPITDKYRLHILSKVRMADLVQVKKGLSKSKYYSAFGKIKAKHVDFVLADPKNLRILLAIELDDNSHNDVNAQQKDYFEDKVFETVGLPLIRTRNIEGVEAQICEKLKITKK
ncbi:MAG: DUF2726 domain-containing protein [Ruminococcus sp.]|nr:DUF2726 domain-containing protein [Ruminococcus sp.]